jgi:hypothetical protein
MFEQAPVGSGANSVDVVVVDLVWAYRKAAGERLGFGLVKKYRTTWRKMLTSTAEKLRALDISPDAYVSHVVVQFRKLRGRLPFPQQVFGPKAVDGWMRSYLAASPGEIRPLVYKATDERRRAYALRFRRA